MAMVETEGWRINTSEFWCWKRLLRVLWTARRSKESIIKEINPEYSLKGLMLNLKLQCFGHLMQRRLIGKDLDAGKDWGQEKKGTTEDETVGQHHWLNGHGFGWTPGVGDGQGGLACCGSWGRKESDMTERLNWTEVILVLRWRLWERSYQLIFHEVGSSLVVQSPGLKSPTLEVQAQSLTLAPRLQKSPAQVWKRKEETEGKKQKETQREKRRKKKRIRKKKRKRKNK